MSPPPKRYSLGADRVFWGKIMLHKGQIDILLTALLVLLVRFCQHLKEYALDFESRGASTGRKTKISDLTNDDR